MVDRIRFKATCYEIEDGEKAPPRWYGLAYHDPCSRMQYWYPIGLHWIVQFLICVDHWWFGVRIWRPRTIKRLRKMVLRARASGYEDGLAHGRHEIVTRIRLEARIREPEGGKEAE